MPRAKKPAEVEEPSLGIDDGPIPQTPPEEPEAAVVSPGAPKPKKSHHGPNEKRNRRSKLEVLRDEVAADIEQANGFISLGLAVVSPTAAEFNESRSAKTTDDILRLCVRHPKLAQLLKQSGDAMAYVGVVQWIAGIALAVGVDLGKVDPEVFAARALGVTEAYRIVQKENNGEGSGPGSGGFRPPAPLARVAAEG